MAWWIAVTHPSNERRAVRGLNDRGFETWLPMRTVEIRKSRYMKAAVKREYPLFPGYLFVRPSGRRPIFQSGMIEGHWARVIVGHEPHVCRVEEMAGVDGFRSVLCNNWRPLVLSDEEVEVQRFRLDRRAEMPMIEDAWCVGDQLICTDGPFFSFPGTVERGDQRGVLKVLMDIFGRPTPVEMTVDQVRRVA